MAKSQILIAFYSTYGTNWNMAKIAAEAVSGTDAEVRLRKFPETAPREAIESQEKWKKQIEKMQSIPELTHDDLEWAQGYLFSAPTRFGVPASQVRAFIDSCGPLWQDGKLANKVVTAMTSAQNVHGGQEQTILSIYTTCMHWGAIIVAPGYTNPVLFKSGGNPYGFSCTPGDLSSEQREAIEHQARRLVEFTAKLS